MMKKSLYLFPLLCLIGAPLAHSEVVFTLGSTIPIFVNAQKTKPPLTNLPNRQRKSYCSSNKPAHCPHRLRH